MTAVCLYYAWVYFQPLGWGVEEWLSGWGITPTHSRQFREHLFPCAFIGLYEHSYWSSGHVVVIPMLLVAFIKFCGPRREGSDQHPTISRFCGAGSLAKISRKTIIDFYVMSCNQVMLCVVESLRQGMSDHLKRQGFISAWGAILLQAENILWLIEKSGVVLISGSFFRAWLVKEDPLNRLHFASVGWIVSLCVKFAFIVLATIKTETGFGIKNLDVLNFV